MNRAADRRYHRNRYRTLTKARIESAIRFYATSMPDHEPETNDDEEDGSPSFTEPPESTPSTVEHG